MINIKKFDEFYSISKSYKKKQKANYNFLENQEKREEGNAQESAQRQFDRENGTFSYQNVISRIEELYSLLIEYIIEILQRHSYKQLVGQTKEEEDIWVLHPDILKTQQ